MSIDDKKRDMTSNFPATSKGWSSPDSLRFCPTKAEPADMNNKRAASGIRNTLLTALFHGLYYNTLSFRIHPNEHIPMPHKAKAPGTGIVGVLPLFTNASLPPPEKP